MTLAITWGMWFGIVYRRWGVTGLLASLTCQALLCAVAVLAVSFAHGWQSTGSFFTTLTVEGLTDILAAALAFLAFLACGFATARRATV